jgi:hypothetical protein
MTPSLHKFTSLCEQFVGKIKCFIETYEVKTFIVCCVFEKNIRIKLSISKNEVQNRLFFFYQVHTKFNVTLQNISRIKT